MRANVYTDANGDLTIQMEGGLDFDNNIPLREELVEIVEGHPNVKVTLDLYNLDFVGSSGIGHFVETIKIINQKKSKICLQNVNSEFLKVFKLYDHDDLMTTLLDEFETNNTFSLAQHFAARKNTFEN